MASGRAKDSPRSGDTAEGSSAGAGIVVDRLGGADAGSSAARPGEVCEAEAAWPRKIQGGRPSTAPEAGTSPTGSDNPCPGDRDRRAGVPVVTGTTGESWPRRAEDWPRSIEGERPEGEDKPTAEPGSSEGVGAPASRAPSHPSPMDRGVTAAAGCRPPGEELSAEASSNGRRRRPAPASGFDVAGGLATSAGTGFGGSGGSTGRGASGVPGGTPTGSGAPASARPGSEGRRSSTDEGGDMEQPASASSAATPIHGRRRLIRGQRKRACRTPTIGWGIAASRRALTVSWATCGAG